MEDRSVIAPVLFVICMFGGSAFFIIMASMKATDDANHRWQAECVAGGVAEYDTKTGEWKWIAPKESEATSE